MVRQNLFLALTRFGLPSVFAHANAELSLQKKYFGAEEIGLWGGEERGKGKRWVLRMKSTKLATWVLMYKG